MKLRTFKMSAVALVLGVGAAIAAPMAAAQESAPAAAAPKKPSGPVICPGYVKGKTTLVGERTGKKVQQHLKHITKIVCKKLSTS